MGHWVFDCYREPKMTTKILLALNLDPNLSMLYVLLTNYLELVLRGKAFKELVNEKNDHFEQHRRTHRSDCRRTEKYFVQQ